jgi:hypothetical protein
MRILSIITDGVNKGKKWISTIGFSAGASSAFQVPHLNAVGTLDPSFLPSSEADKTSCPASENLSAGDRVSLWDDAGTTKARKADASNGRKADGYVTAAVTSGATAFVYHDGTQAGLTGLTPGGAYYLSATTPGGIVAIDEVRTQAGDLVQYVGRAKSATELLWEPETDPATVVD